MERARIRSEWSRTARRFLTRVLVVVLCLTSLSLGISGCEEITDRLGLNQSTDSADEVEVETETDIENGVGNGDAVESIDPPRTFERDRTDDDALDPPDSLTEPRTPTAPDPAATNPNAVRPDDQLILRNIIASETGRSQIAAPENWQQEFMLHPTAELQASAPLDQLYFIALADDSFNSANTTLENRSSRYLQQFIDSLSSTESVRQTNVRRVGGYPAIQYQVQAELDGVLITYLHTTVTTPLAYYQLLSWTERSQFPAYQEELQLVTQSFELS